MNTQNFQDPGATTAMEAAHSAAWTAGTRPPDELTFSHMIDALSERMLRHWGTQPWRELFLGPSHGDIRFRRASLTLLLADAPWPGMRREEGGLLAERLGAQAQVCCGAEVGLAFRDPATALRAALVVQRLVAARPVRAALTSSRCIVAEFDLAGVQHQMVIGPEIDQAETAVRAAPPGTIVVTAEAYRFLRDVLPTAVDDAVVATELEGERVTRASITLAPRCTDALSTFAGLGQM